MAFDDLARRMGASPGTGGSSGSATVDPDQIIAEAQIAARRAARLRDFVLGPLLLVGGVIIVLLWINVRVHAATTTDPRDTTIRPRDFSMMSYIVVAGVAAIVVGLHKILRGLGVFKR